MDFVSICLLPRVLSSVPLCSPPFDCCFVQLYNEKIELRLL